jgi:uncharacterized membrane protein YecN with MAPEG domain
MNVPVTVLYGALLALFYVFLSINVSRNRGEAGVFLEQGKTLPEALYLANRAHGNASEYIPFAVLLLLLMELSHASYLWLHIFGGVLLIARVLHAVGVLRKVTPLQITGISLTWLTLLVQAIWLLVLRFKGA